MNSLKISRIAVQALFGVLAAAALAAAAILWPGPGYGPDPFEFKIETGQTLNETAKLLDEGGFIRSRYLFVAYTILTGKEKKFQAGRYLVPPRASMRDLVKLFSFGLAETDTEVTIPEGTNVADTDRIFADAGLIKRGDLIYFSRDLPLWPEGFLFPDTYRFREAGRTDLLSAEEVINRMRDNFNKKTEKIFKNMTEEKIREIIIIASMLEKEVKTSKDMALVAGIIAKRLELDMPLQIDATVAYGVCLPKWLGGSYCDVSKANLVDNIPIDTVYNTYRRIKLPVGPISNPGLTAVKAALNPEPSEYLYYLSAKDGTTIFSKTAAEHEAARQKYLK